MNRGLCAILWALLAFAGTEGLRAESPRPLDAPDADPAPAAAMPWSLADLTAPRPRLRVEWSPVTAASPLDPVSAPRPAFTWSLEAWQQRMDGLAHLHCSRARHTLEAILAEDCRFVDRPLPEGSANLVQVRGRWMAAPGLSLGAGLFRGAVPGTGDALRWSGLDPDPVMPDGRIEGMRMDVSFGVHLGRVGDLLLDLQLERYRRSAGPSLALAPEPADFSSFTDDRVRHAGQLGLGWRGQRFGADLTGQVRELPAWLGGEDARHHSFDLELSWRSPINSTIRVGVTNLLDDVPDDNPGASMEGIFGRIPYVRYQHDL